VWQGLLCLPSYNPSEMLPLHKRRILITRTRRQASYLAAQLEALGATTIAIPTIEIVPPASYAPLDEALACLGDFAWLIFTSANAVEAFAARLTIRGLAPVALPKIAVIGPATARAVEAQGFAVDLIPQWYVAESLIESLLPHAPGSRMLLVRAEEARDVLPESLSAAGAEVIIAPAYRNQLPTSSISSVREIFAPPDVELDAITFTSASTARNLAALLGQAGLAIPSGVVLASIGPITSEALRELGYRPTVEAGESTIPALVTSLTEYFESAR
jgi:uroporphyrinogen-III synthase